MYNPEINIVLNLKIVEGKMNVTIGFPSFQPQLTLEETAIALASGISLLVKGCSEDTGIKDFELMEKVVGYLNDEFIKVDSFGDAKIYKNGFRGQNLL